MKVLLVNKFLYIKGGAETYVFKLGETLEKYGHEVQFFGLENEKNIVGNRIGSYVKAVNLTGNGEKNFVSPFKLIYSSEARKKIRDVLDDFQPDIVHLNNIQFHLTPSIILEVHKYRKKTGRDVKIIYTAHDYQLICPSHGLFDTGINVCEKCLGGNYLHCIKTKCVKNSRSKSIIGAFDAYWWKFSRAYSYVDTIVCPSEFLKKKLDTQKRFASKTVALHNFIELYRPESVEKSDYILEFGHLSKDKGTLTLLEAAKRMPEMKFIFAGYGKAEEEIRKVSNAEFVGFKKGDELKNLISGARCSVYPSEWYENCPFSVIESQMYMTPVIGSRMGGIPEIIREGETGLLFEAGNSLDLEAKIRYLMENVETFTENCRNVSFETPDTYYEKLIKIYGEKV